jgi:hypothetical protein
MVMSIWNAGKASQFMAMFFQVACDVLQIRMICDNRIPGSETALPGLKFPIHLGMVFECVCSILPYCSTVGARKGKWSLGPLQMKSERREPISQHKVKCKWRN